MLSNSRGGSIWSDYSRQEFLPAVLLQTSISVSVISNPSSSSAAAAVEVLAAELCGVGVMSMINVNSLAK